MADGDATIRLDRGGVNARILAKEAKVDFRRVEAASRKIPTTLYGPEAKRLYARYFNSMQLNIYVISVIGRTKLPPTSIEKVEGTLKARLEQVHSEINGAIDSAEALCKAHGITRLATYDTEPLTIEVKVISPFGRRYLELITKVDQLMPMLETLAIDEVIAVPEFDLQKGLVKKSVRQIAGAARNFRIGLRQRMNAPTDANASVIRAPSAKPDLMAEAVASTSPCDTNQTKPVMDGASAAATDRSAAITALGALPEQSALASLEAAA